MGNLSVYIHVPFCAVRCGYCDFNTYTNADLGGGGSRAEYPAWAKKEMSLTHAADLRAGYNYEQIDTVFFGGGTPTMLPVETLSELLQHARSLIPLAPGAEVTTEANPDSVTAASLRYLAEAGFTRVSFGMQSAVPHVLKTLDRTHNPERIEQVVQWAKEAGLAVSLDLIYGTPGESLSDWATSVKTALSCDIDHLSAYSLIIEGNTAMARQLRRGEITPVDDETMAQMYEYVNAEAEHAGFNWYEVSNFARTSEQECRHNLAYWQGKDWWGIGPGAHRHRDGYRSWNVKHPTRYAQILKTGNLPVEDSETLSARDKLVEYVMLNLRTRYGVSLLEVAKLDPQLDLEAFSNRAQQEVEKGLLKPEAFKNGELILTAAGRLLADGITRNILP